MGQEERNTRLVESLKPIVKAVARKIHLHGSETDQEDAAQHLYEYIIRKPESFLVAGVRSTDAWARVILTRQARKRLKTVLQTRDREEGTDWTESEELTLPEEQPTPEQQYEANELIERLRRTYKGFYRGLSPRDRRIMRAIRQNVSSEETGKTVGLTSARIRQIRPMLVAQLLSAMTLV